ncbi:hypothetical protein ACQJBY_005719 [Aegilops geniculata]
MHSVSISASASASAIASGGARSKAAAGRRPGEIRFCGLRGDALACASLRASHAAAATRRAVLRAAASANGAAGSSDGFDYDLVIIGAGVGGHGAALHAVEEGLKTAIIEGDVVGGTCVNRGCVPSKALLAVSGRMRELHDEHHMKSLGLQVSSTGYDRQAVADHANNLASKIRSNLTNSMKAMGVDILTGFGKIVGKQKVRYGKVGFPEKEITAKNIIIATGSVPFVPKGIEIDGKTVFTSDHALKLESVPEWIAIVGSGYIGLEFSDVYTALGSEITPAKDGKPVLIELIDAKTKEHKETLEVDAALIATGRAPFTSGLGLENINVVTQRGFIPVDERMQVTDADGNVVPNLFCIGDANGKLMLAHAASAQGISVVEQISGRDHILNHLSIPAACFTHPEISMVGLTEPQAREKADNEGFEVSVVKTSFKANTKALAENEGDGIAKMIYRPDTGEILGVHILGLHAADLIHEASNAIALGTRLQELKLAVHAHPTLSEVLDELFKAAKVNSGVSHSVNEPVAA